MSNSTGKAVAGGAVGLLTVILRMCAHDSGEVAHEAENIFAHEAGNASHVAKNEAARSTETIVDYPLEKGQIHTNVDEESHPGPHPENEININDEHHKTAGITSPETVGPAFEMKAGVVFSNRDLSEDDIRQLSKEGVKFVCNKEIYIQQAAITNYKILYIYSGEIEKLKNLYDINDKQAEDVISYSTSFIENPLVKAIASKDQLDDELKSCKSQNITPVVVFHNKGQQLFDTPIEEYQLTNVITCNSYKIPKETFFKSTDFIDLKYVVESLDETFTATNQNLFDFYSSFSKHYSDHLQKAENGTTAVVVAGIGVTGAGVGLIVYYTNDKKDTL